jgi:peptide deformylase
MTLRKIAGLGHPVLRQKANKVPAAEINSPRIQDLIEDMITTMREHEGVGLAAPQVYEPLRIFAVESKGNGRYPDRDAFDLIVFINPEILKQSEKKEVDWEGCLSIPDLHGRVPRSSQISVRASDRRGKPFNIEARGFLARAIQHEYDHLEGVLFPDRMSDLSTLTNTFEFKRYWYPRFPEASAR